MAHSLFDRPRCSFNDSFCGCVAGNAQSVKRISEDAESVEHCLNGSGKLELLMLSTETCRVEGCIPVVFPNLLSCGAPSNSLRRLKHSLIGNREGVVAQQLPTIT